MIIGVTDYNRICTTSISIFIYMSTLICFYFTRTAYIINRID